MMDRDIEIELLEKENHKLRKIITDLKIQIDSQKFLCFTSSGYRTDPKIDMIIGKLFASNERYISFDSLYEIIEEITGSMSHQTMLKYRRILINKNAIEKIDVLNCKILW